MSDPRYKTASSSAFAIGARVRITDLAGQPDRKGTVSADSGLLQVEVLVDGNKSPHRIHWSRLKLIDPVTALGDLAR